ncbi:MAG: F0F1 ATP synthase subunit B [Erysipelotrichaceae bacterium]|nr:F0F1 ATP synthase subunit B [Erysipelotrichaceae bacterium]
MSKSKRTLWILLPLCGVLLSACQGSPFQDSDFVSKIFPNGYWDFLIQLIAFILLLLIVFFLGYKPIRKMMKKREDAVNGMIAETKANQAIAKKAALEKDQTIEEGKKEAERIVLAAKQNAEFEANRIVSEAKEEAVARRKKADEDILRAQEASKEEVRQQIIDVAMLASKQVLGREVSSKDNERLVDDFVADLEKKEG